MIILLRADRLINFCSLFSSFCEIPISVSYENETFHICADSLEQAPATEAAQGLSSVPRPWPSPVLMCLLWGMPRDAKAPRLASSTYLLMQANAFLESGPLKQADLSGRSRGAGSGFSSSV